MKPTFSSLMNRAQRHDTEVRFWDYISKVSSKVLAHSKRHSKYHAVMRDTALMELFELGKNKTDK